MTFDIRKFLGWSKPKNLFTYEIPNTEEFIGLTVTIGNERVKIKKIEGMKFQPKFYLINNKYEMNILRFFAQMNHCKDITEQQFRDFEEMDVSADKK